MSRKVVGISVASCIVALAIAGLSAAQPPNFGGGPGGRRFDPEEMRRNMDNRLREQLGATPEEWKVLGPRVQKVMTLSRQTRSGRGMARMFMRRPGGPGGPGSNRPNRQDRQNRLDRQDRPNRPNRPEGGMFGRGEPSPVDTATDELQTTLENASATPEEIKSKLTALRQAKEKAKQELAVAQKELREVLTLRQEAQLVVMGLLD